MNDVAADARRMRVAHISLAHGLPVVSRFGGAIQRRILEMSRVQARLGHDVTIFSVGDAPGTVELEGIRIISLAPRLPMILRHAEFQREALRQLGRLGGADVIHFHSQPEGSLLQRNVPGVRVLSFDFFEFRGGRRSPLHPLVRHCLTAFDALLPCSDYCLRESSSYWKIDPARMRPLYNGVNITQFTPDPAAGAGERELAGIEGPVVLYVGRLCEQKGTDLLIDAVSRIRAHSPAIRLVVAGPIGQFEAGSDGEAHWRRRIDAVNGVYLGIVPEERLAAVYNMADVFVMPTRDLEMFGMAAVEAQACGVPCVASDHGGLRETVPVECGGRFPVGDTDALATCITTLLEDAALRRLAGLNARHNALRFDWNRIVADAESCYRMAS